jgi:S1-C subfamily serine protease
LQRSVSVGVVSGFNRDEPISDPDTNQTRLFKGLLQTSAPINPGNSGGPLVDYSGRVIGVNQSTASPQAGAQGIGFAIPASTVMQTASVLAKNPGKVLDANGTGTGKGFLGVAPVDITNNVRTQLGGYHDQGGVAIANVVSGTPADQAGLEPGDVVAAMKPGAKVTLRVWSQGIKKNVSVTLAEQPVSTYLQNQDQNQNP